MFLSPCTPPLGFASEIVKPVGQPERKWHAALLGIAILVLPQLSTFLWWIQNGSAMHLRGYINAEYLILFAISLAFPNWFSVSVLTFELAVSLVEPLAHLYYFSPRDAVASFRYLNYVPAHLLVVYFSLLMAYVVFCAGFTRFALMNTPRKWAMPLATALIVSALTSFGFDLIKGQLRPLHSTAERGDADLRSVRNTRAPGASLLYAMFIPGHTHRTEAAAVSLPSAMEHAVAGIPAGSKPNIVLVLTESWGLALDPRVNRAESAPYGSDELARLYDVQSGTVRFAGGTTSGETRELCGNSGGRNAESINYSSCWPAIFDRAGYTTVGVHGFTPTMFERDEWYKQFGFSDAAFLPELERDGARLCDGAFPGACDASVAHWIGNRLKSQGDGHPAFVHWVTLNSHLPVAPIAGPEAQMECERVEIDSQGSLCAWFNRVFLVHQSVAQLALTPGLAPTIFVIVGDHAPPFLNPTARAKFSQELVPWVILTPRAISARAPNVLVASSAHLSGSAREHARHIMIVGAQTTRHQHHHKVKYGSGAAG